MSDTLGSDGKRVVDKEEPMELGWVKLQKPARDAEKLLKTAASELFDFTRVSEAKHEGFKYKVKSLVDGGVEAAINFLESKNGPSLFLETEKGFSVMKQEADGSRIPRHITHAFVFCMGMPFMPIIKSVSFYDVGEVVMSIQA